MIGKDQSISNHHIFPSTSVENHDFCDVARCQWLAATMFLSASKRTFTRGDLPVDRICFGFVTRKPNDGEFGFNLPRVDLHHSNSSRDQFPAQRFCEYSNCSFSSTIYRSSRIALSTRNASNVYDISSAAFISFLEDLEDSLDLSKSAFDNIRTEWENRGHGITSDVLLYP